MESYVYGVYIV